jgi:transcriptional regulator with XRE-family HTH domain
MSLPEHPFQRLDGESEALKQLAGGPDLSVHELAEALGVEVAEVEGAWRGEEPLSIRARWKLADLLAVQAARLGVLERTVRRPILRVDSAAHGELEPEDHG